MKHGIERRFSERVTSMLGTNRRVIAHSNRAPDPVAGEKKSYSRQHAQGRYKLESGISGPF